MTDSQNSRARADLETLAGEWAKFCDANHDAYTLDDKATGDELLALSKFAHLCFVQGRREGLEEAGLAIAAKWLAI